MLTLKSVVDLPTALDAVHLSKAAYTNETGRVQDDPAFLKTGYTYLDDVGEMKLDLFGYWAKKDDTLALVFRGMRAVEDFFLNAFTIQMTETSMGWVHAGTYNAFKSLVDEIQTGLDNYCVSPVNKFLVTGHSLGGALACLVGANYQYTGCAVKVPNISVYTFGQPRIGDDDFADSYPAPTARFVNDNDFVPTLPPRIVPGTIDPPRFYKHTCHPALINSEGKLQDAAYGTISMNKETEELRWDFSRASAQTRLHHVLCGFEPHQSVAAAKLIVLQGLNDHRIANYVAKVEALVS